MWNNECPLFAFGHVYIVFTNYILYLMTFLKQNTISKGTKKDFRHKFLNSTTCGLKVIHITRVALCALNISSVFLNIQPEACKNQLEFKQSNV
ncbi:unnamed protein product [Allacma fusca]|uniref:Uncharacterized protein n=1 Tax=Allacma fusca TaxID=39272 RepID=A0A8J2NQ24_9HEXA|nr:unnamed protein product [Allacma fusca]